MEQISSRPFVVFTEPFTALLDVYYPPTEEGPKIKEHIKLEPEVPWTDREAAKQAACSRAHEIMAEKHVLFVLYGVHDEEAHETHWYGAKPT